MFLSSSSTSSLLIFSLIFLLKILDNVHYKPSSDLPHEASALNYSIIFTLSIINGSCKSRIQQNILNFSYVSLSNLVSSRSLTFREEGYILLLASHPPLIFSDPLSESLTHFTMLPCTSHRKGIKQIGKTRILLWNEEHLSPTCSLSSQSYKSACRVKRYFLLSIIVTRVSIVSCAFIIESCVSSSISSCFRSYVAKLFLQQHNIFSIQYNSLLPVIPQVVASPDLWSLQQLQQQPWPVCGTPCPTTACTSLRSTPSCRHGTIPHFLRMVRINGSIKANWNKE